MCISVMDNYRQIVLFCKLDLAYKHRFLSIFIGAVVVMVIKANLPHRDRLFVRKQVFKLEKHIIVKAFGEFRMNPYRLIHKGVSMGNFESLFAKLKAASVINNSTNAVFVYGAKQMVTVIIKRRVVIMRMGIENIFVGAKIGQFKVIYNHFISSYKHSTVLAVL